MVSEPVCLPLLLLGPDISEELLALVSSRSAQGRDMLFDEFDRRQRHDQKLMQARTAGAHPTVIARLLELALGDLPDPAEV